VERPSQLLPEVRLGHLGLGGLKLLAVDGVADLEQLDEWESAVPLLDTLPAEARRVAVSRTVDRTLRDLLQGHMHRARRWPEDAFREADAGGGGVDEAGSTGGGGATGLSAGQAPTEEARLALLIATIGSLPEATAIRVWCRSAASVPGVSAALASAGLEVAEASGDWDVVAVTAGSAEDVPSDGDTLLWFGLPLAAERLAAGGAGARRVAIVDSAHRAHLDLMTGRIGAELRSLPDLAPAAELDPLERYRRIVRARVEQGETDAELLVLAPLLREFGTTRVVAALSHLLRRSSGGEAGIRPWADVEAATLPGARGVGESRERAAAPEKRGLRSAWSRVYVGAGKRDDVRAGDLVGAITGETGIAGAQIGKIDIRGNFSLIEIDSMVVDEVIRKLDGTTIRGRTVSVRPDRER
jgi:ATP-dependent RNA helicase DeaD